METNEQEAIIGEVTPKASPLSEDSPIEPKIESAEIEQVPAAVDNFVGQVRSGASETMSQYYDSYGKDYISFKRKFIEHHQNVLQSSGSDDVLLDFDLTEEEVQSISVRLISVFSTSKSPIQVLNEVFNQKVKVLDKGSYGPPHEPLHVTCVNLEKIGNFLGRARSKQESKQYAAKLALGFLQQLNFSYQNCGIAAKKKSKNKKTKILKPLSDFAESMGEASQSDNLNCDNLQTEIIHDVEQIGINTPDPLSREFHLDNVISQAVYEAVMTKSNVFAPEYIEELLAKNSGQAQLNSLDLWRYKEIAGFVLISDLDQSIRVLSLGTGTKCVSSEHLSMYGNVVQDSHAEVIARRALICVLYEHLQALLDNHLQDKPNFILEPSEGGKGFRLKPHLKLHLYISSSPCGDARLFNFIESKNNRNHYAKGVLRVKVDKGQGSIPMPINYISTWDGILSSSERCTFMSCSDKICLWNVVGVQGSLLSFFLEPIYIESLIISKLFQSKNVIRAAHGRLISEVINPLLGSDSLYHVNTHKVGHFNRKSNDAKNAQVLTPIFSHNWFDSFSADPHNVSDQIEIIKSENGLSLFSNKQSRLCKLALLDRFKQLVQNHANIPSIIPYNIESFDYEAVYGKSAETVTAEVTANPKKNDTNDIGNKILINNLKRTYSGLKNSSFLYKRAKIALFRAFNERGLGSWVKSPVDVDLFDNQLISTQPVE